MCGICGYFDFKATNRTDPGTIHRMMNSIYHRGPDDSCYCIKEGVTFGFTRLSIIDVDGECQPYRNEDSSIILICNGEIFNYRELRETLIVRGHRFRTSCDVEVIIHLYEEYGHDFLHLLNGQFSFALYDSNKKEMFCVRDPCGIVPFYYTLVGDSFVFGSEIKAILQHKNVVKRIDLTGLDQIMHFPGMAAPKTLFQDIKSLQGGHYLIVSCEKGIQDIEYWDLVYQEEGEPQSLKPESYYAEKLDELITKAVRRRLQADVPVGFYLSGGLDSSIIAGKISELEPEKRRDSFSICFQDDKISEKKYQDIMAKQVNSLHHSIPFNCDEMIKQLYQAVYHSETALKETYNTASLSLSHAAYENNIKVILTGEGADELFGGYIGYRFDAMKHMQQRENINENPMEKNIRKILWGDENFLYEKNHYVYGNVVQELYSDEVNAIYKDISCMNHSIINKERLNNIHSFHKRSYIDFKLRMSDHLLSDHGDRMAMANSVEARYPFLDPEIIEFVKTIPVSYKLKHFNEKYILKKAAERIVPPEILNRPKFAFVAPGSPELLKGKNEMIEDILSYEVIKKQGIFNPDTVEKLRKQYMQDDFRLNIPYDNDMLVIVITFGMFLNTFYK